MNGLDNIKMSQAELEQLISKYFDCETSEAEEAALKQALAECGYNSPVIDDARVAMGFFLVGKTVDSGLKRKRASVYLWRAMSIAATVAVLIMVGAGLFRTDDILEDDKCIAYVNGEVVHDQDVVMSLIKHDLNNVNSASSTVENSIENQLSAIRSVLQGDK